jgi:alpha-beta hydrolase superfamily lysophospholipase
MRQDLHLALRHFTASCDEQSGSERPVFIVSHSLGSLVTASYLLQVGNEDELARRVQGVVLLAPGFAVSEPPGWRGWLQNPLIRLSFYAEEHFLHPQSEPLPLLIFNQVLSLVIVPVLDGLFEVFSWPGLRNLFTPTAPAWVLDYLTDSEEEKARLRADDWIVRRSLLRYVKGIEGEIVRFRRHMDQFAIPYLLISSENDPITPSWGIVDFAHATLKNCPDNKLLALPNLRYHQHLFLKEPSRQETLTAIELWLDRRMHSLND